ncbi:MAG: AMP-binding protein [Nocardioidaceae bacterium]
MPPASSAHVDTFCRDNLPPEDSWPRFSFELPELRYPDRLNCAAVLVDDTAARLGPDRLALLSPAGERWTYGDLRRVSNQVARVLVDELGVVPGNRVLLRGPNNPWLVACWAGALKAGAVVVTSMALLRPRELSTVHDIARIDVALCDHRFLDDLRAADLGPVPIVPYGSDDAEDLTVRASAYDGSFAPVATAADDVALLAFTSGTTGRPKATMHFHRDVLANADTFSRHVLKPTADDVFTGTPPLAFTFGLGALVVFPLHVGAASLLIEQATPNELAEHIAAY